MEPTTRLQQWGRTAPGRAQARPVSFDDYGGERLLNAVGGTSSLLAQTLPFPPFGRGGSPEKGVVLD